MSKKPNFAEIASRNKIETTFAAISGFSEQEEDLNNSENKDKTEYADKTEYTDKTDDANKTEYTDKTDDANKTEDTYKTENTYKTEDADTKKVKIKKESAAETKSKRLNLLVKPSFVENIAKIATMEKRSSNDLINSILEEYIEKNQDVIKKHDKVFGA